MTGVMDDGRLPCAGLHAGVQHELPVEDASGYGLHVRYPAADLDADAANEHRLCGADCARGEGRGDLGEGGAGPSGSRRLSLDQSRSRDSNAGDRF